MRLTVTFAVGTNLDIAQVQVQNRVAIAQPILPAEVQRQGITVKKASPDITLVIQAYSPDQSLDTLYMSNYVTLQIRDELARLPGVGDILVFGARDYSMRLWLDPDKLASRQITAGDVVKAIQEQNVQVAAGVVGGPPLPAEASKFQYTVTAQGRLTDPKEFAAIIVKVGNDGRVTYLRDVARVELGAADYSSGSAFDRKPSIGIAIFQLPGSNAIATADAVYAKMLDLKKNFPQGMEVLLEVQHLGVNRVGGGDGVGAGELKDRDADRRLAIECAAAAVVGCAELDSRDVAQISHSSVIADLDDDRRKLLRIGQPALRGDGVLKLARLCRQRRSAD